MKLIAVLMTLTGLALAAASIEMTGAVLQHDCAAVVDVMP